MTRAAANAPQTVTVAPTSNVYTALTAAASIAVLMGLIVLFLRASALQIKILPF
ncbi:MAG TPA: hypothetical protein VHD56_12150 [Tepidisphaeraceae bacterium]|nr:hypothetical protein [Tepidisphaeraceae bacterium]